MFLKKKVLTFLFLQLKLSSLIQWHNDDPVDDFEINRNEIIFGFQENRNPFVDHPNLVNFLWGENYGENWNENLGLISPNDENFVVYPNPSNGILNFSNPLQDERVEIFSSDGVKVFDIRISNANLLKLNLEAGIYFLKISNNRKITNSKIIFR